MTKARPTGKQAASAATYQQLRVHALVANPLQPVEMLPKSRTSGHTRSTGAGSTPDTVTVTRANELMPARQA